MKSHIPEPPEPPKGYAVLDGIGIFDWEDRPIGFCQKFKRFLEFWKTDYRKNNNLI